MINIAKLITNKITFFLCCLLLLFRFFGESLIFFSSNPIIELFPQNIFVPLGFIYNLLYYKIISFLFYGITKIINRIKYIKNKIFRNFNTISEIIYNNCAQYNINCYK